MFTSVPEKIICMEVKIKYKITVTKNKRKYTMFTSVTDSIVCMTEFK